MHATAIAQELRCHPRTIRERLCAFNAHGLEGLRIASGAGPESPLAQEERSCVMEPGGDEASDARFQQLLQSARSRGVPRQLLHTYLRMNGEFPMAPAATDPAIGYEVLAAVARHGEPDPAETEIGWKSTGLDWMGYYYSAFSPQQLDIIGHTVTQIHLDAGIPIMTAEHLPYAALAHPTNREKLEQLSGILDKDFVHAEPPSMPPNCSIQETEFGKLAIVPLEVFNNGWNDIKERVFLAILNVIDTLGEARRHVTQPRLDARDGSPLTEENALRLAQFFASSTLDGYQKVLLALYEAAYTTINAAADLAEEQHAAYQLTAAGAPNFRVTHPLEQLIERINEAILTTAKALPLQGNGQPAIPAEAVTGFINDITRRASEPTN